MRRPAPELLQLERWPTVDVSALKPVARQVYRKRARALDLYVRGQPLAKIERRSGLGRQVLYRAIERVTFPPENAIRLELEPSRF